MCHIHQKKEYLILATRDALCKAHQYACDENSDTKIVLMIL